MIPSMKPCPGKSLEQLQLDRLKATVKKVYRAVPFYKKAFKERGIEPGDIKTLEDIKKLPFTYKQDLRDNYPYGLFTAPMDKIIRLHASSGTTGKPSWLATRKKIYQTGLT